MYTYRKHNKHKKINTIETVDYRNTVNSILKSKLVYVNKGLIIKAIFVVLRYAECSCRLS